MKKSILFLLAASALLSACQKNEITSLEDTPVLHAVIEDDALTKTSMDADNNVLWSAGDQVVAFMKTSFGKQYQIKEQYVGKNSGYFSKVSSESSDDLGAGVEFDYNVVYYPYSDATECTKSGSSYSLGVVLPSEQNYTAGSFSNGSFPMVAVSEDNNITFRNVCGGMKLQLKGTQKVTSIRLEGKNSEKLSGAATVTAYTDEIKPAITMSYDASTSVTLDCGDGVQLSGSTATEFIISLPPVLFSKGFTVTITDSDNNVQTVGTDKSNEVKRSSILVMPEMTLETSIVDPEEPESQLYDYVDEYGVNHGKGGKIGNVTWAPVNCGYHATDYKYGKLYQWGRRYGQGYSGGFYVGEIEIGTYSDAYIAECVPGPVSLSIGQSESNSSKFYYLEGSRAWVNSQEDALWNAGTDENPVKTEYDPCPSGWRVPTYSELSELVQHDLYWTTDDADKAGWFIDANTYSSEVPRVFFPAAGFMDDCDGDCCNRGCHGIYWSSKPDSYNDANIIELYDVEAEMNFGVRSGGFSVRCVQE